MSVKVFIHSVETFGTVDGPGIRYIIFTSGCGLKCLYCHNPDTWKMTEGKPTTSDELVQDILRYKSYIKASGGGVTISGGEPLLQPLFVKDIINQLHQHEIHVAIDTNGFPDIDNANVKAAVDAVDLVLLDIKHFNPKKYKDITAQELQPTLNMAEYLKLINKATWIRFVYVPGLTDDLEDLHALAKYISQLSNVLLVEVLPFHKFGEHKWQVMGLEYKLHETKEPTQEQTNAIRAVFVSYGLKVQ